MYVSVLFRTGLDADWHRTVADHFAVASTDTGHNGSVGDGTFVLNGEETQFDFGYRAVHLTAVYAKQIVEVREAYHPVTSGPFESV